MASDSAVEIGTKQIFVEETKEAISIAYYTLNVAEGVDFDIAIGDRDEDEISEAIANQTYFVSPAFHFLFTLMKPDDIILDLGAHIGTFSFAAAALGCQVISVEASPHNVALLKATAVKNSFNQVQIISSAVSNCSGTVEFVPGGPYGLVANPTINSGCITVPAITGDDLLANLGLDRVDLIKMDIEGSEIRAIEGMSQLLAREDAPPILYEGNGHALRFFGETSSRLIGTLERFGYRSYFVEAGQLMPVQPGDLQWICTVDYLAVKHFPDDLSGWQVVGPMSLEEKIAQILFSCQHPHKHYRAYVARTLSQADEAILSDQRVIGQLELLQEDPNPEVRDAASWWREARIQYIKSTHALELMRQKVQVDDHWPIAWPYWPSGLWDKVVALGQKVTRRLLQWYIDPLVRQQNQFNLATLNVLQLLSDEVSALRSAYLNDCAEQQDRLVTLTKQIEVLRQSLPLKDL